MLCCNFYTPYGSVTGQLWNDCTGNCFSWPMGDESIEAWSALGYRRWLIGCVCYYFCLRNLPHWLHCIFMWRYLLLYIHVEVLIIVYSCGGTYYCIFMWGYLLLYIHVEVLIIVYSCGGTYYCILCTLSMSHSIIDCKKILI
jgi:hypothetical protein